jgi:polar amino acid transport system substrate-binding protein
VGLYTGSPTSYIKAEARIRRAVSVTTWASGSRNARMCRSNPWSFRATTRYSRRQRRATSISCFTNATPARAQFIDFTPPALEIEKSYLVPASSAIREISAIDRQGVRVGVSRGSSSEGELKQILKNATLLQMPSLDEAGKALSDGRLEAFGPTRRSSSRCPTVFRVRASFPVAGVWKALRSACLKGAPRRGSRS